MSARSTTSPTTEMTGKNIGDLLNAKGITWGSFMGGFNLQAVNANGTTGCKRSTSSPTVGSNVDRLQPASCAGSSIIPRRETSATPGRPRSLRSGPRSMAAPITSMTSPTSSLRFRPATSRRSASSRLRRSRTLIPATRIRSMNRSSWSTSSTCCSRAPSGRTRR